MRVAHPSWRSRNPSHVGLAEEETTAAHSLTETLTEEILDQDMSFAEDARAVKTRRNERLKTRDMAFHELADQLKEGLEGRASRGFEEARL